MDTLVNRIIELASQQPDKTAVAFKKEQLTYRQLAMKAAGMADGLRQLGVRPGDRVCFSAVSKPETAVCYLAVHMAGAVAVFLDKNGTPQNMAAVYDEAEAVLLLTDKPMKEHAGERRVVSLRGLYQSVTVSGARDGADAALVISDFLRPDEALRTVSSGELPAYLASHRIDPEGDALAELLFTSGTTGRPKGVMLTYEAVYHILRNTIEGVGMREDDVVLLPLPLHHSFALRVLRAALWNGETVVLQNGFTFAKELENNIRAFHCNALALVAASFEVIHSQMQDRLPDILGWMRYLEFGAGAVSIAQRREITSLLPDVDIQNNWGSSESGGAVFCDVSEAVKDERIIGTLGKPIAGVEVRVLDPDGNPIQSDAAHPGRMALRGRMQMSGYWKRPDLTRKTLRDGWLLTGDMVYLDEEGNIFMLGRADDLINVGGEKVSPIEVEEAALQWETVQDCGCIGVADPEGIMGQVPVLFVKGTARFDKDELLRHLSGMLERYKMPQEIIPVDAIPRGRMQKLDRKALRVLWDRRDALELMNPVIQTILSRRSVRRFTDWPVDRAVLELLVKAGRQAPSGHNMQTWHFTVVTDQADLFRLKEAARKAAGARKVYFYGWENPQAVILISNDVRNPYGCQDASCAAENIMLAAASLGLGSVWLNPLMTLRETEPVKSVLDAFGVPAGHTVWAAVALGYPAADGTALARKEDVVTWV